MKKLKSYILTGIDADLWKDFKTACAHYNISIRSVFLNLITSIVEDHKDPKKLSTYTTKASKKRVKH